MGLDWNPLGKPKPGQEAAFLVALGEIGGADSWQPGTPIPFVVDADVEAALRRFHALVVTPYETLDAPRVGRDAAAETWIREKYAVAPKKPPTIEEWVRSFQGYWVLDLLPDSDGLPVYSNAPLGGPELFSFRAKFLDDCEEMLGPELYKEAYLNHLPEQLAAYGERLMDKAATLAKAHGVEDVLSSRLPPREPPTDSPEDMAMSQAHIVSSAARWAAFWSSRGHGLHADW